MPTLESSTSELGGQLVVFSLGDEEYALPIGKVQEIIRYTDPRDVHDGLGWIRGVISLRGEIIPVCDLAERLGIEHEHNGNSKIVIVDTEGGTSGVIVDDVNEVIAVAADQLEPVPTNGSELIRAIVKIDSRLIVLVDPDRILAAVGT